MNNNIYSNIFSLVIIFFGISIVMTKKLPQGKSTASYFIVLPDTLAYSLGGFLIFLGIYFLIINKQKLK